MLAVLLLAAMLQAAPSLDNLPTPEPARIATATPDPVIFTAVTPLAGNAELARRTVTPLQAAQLPAILAARHARLSDQPIDPAQEQFGVHVPPSPPTGGRYNLLVFVPPWQSRAIPADWLPVLDATGTILVTAARQGNPETVLGRREPIAILAAWNAMQRYPIDPARVYVAGFSGGAKVALKLALAYPDLFHGVIADAGADPIGTASSPIPPADLFDRFRSDSTVVLVAGSADPARAEQSAAAGSLRAWCVPNVVQRTIDGLGHQPIARIDFARAFGALATPPHPPSAGDERCWQRLLARRDAAFAEVERAARSDGAKTAWRKLDALDRQFGGAAPRSIELSRQLPSRQAGGG